jgi:hypothetical protein
LLIVFAEGARVVGRLADCGHPGSDVLLAERAEVAVGEMWEEAFALMGLEVFEGADGQIWLLAGEPMPPNGSTRSGQTSAAPMPRGAPCHENLPHRRSRRRPGTPKTLRFAGPSRCAEEDSNVPPVSPDQALNLVTQVPYTSRSR